MTFQRGDRVKNREGRVGKVWKVTDKAVHVIWDDSYFQKFHFSPRHHMQTPTNELEKS